MQKEILGVFDSGVGGLSLLIKLNQKLSGYKILYLGDNDNAPYGNKSILELKRLAFENVMILKSYNVNTVFIACNTLSCCLLSFLKTTFPELTFYGVFPPIEKTLVNGQTPLLLCTVATANVLKNSGADIIGFKNLVGEIERLPLGQIDISSNLKKTIKYVGVNSKSKNWGKSTLLTTKLSVKNFNHFFLQNRVVILGCTHYFFAYSKIFNHFRPQAIFDGSDFTVDLFIKSIKNKKSLEKPMQNKILFIGKNKSKNSEFFKSYIYSLKKN